jgi:hypothetical protein
MPAAPSVTIQHSSAREFKPAFVRSFAPTYATETSTHLRARPPLERKAALTKYARPLRCDGAQDALQTERRSQRQLLRRDRSPLRSEPATWPKSLRFSRKIQENREFLAVGAEKWVDNERQRTFSMSKFYCA